MFILSAATSDVPMADYLCVTAPGVILKRPTYKCADHREAGEGGWEWEGDQAPRSATERACGRCLGAKGGLRTLTRHSTPIRSKTAFWKGHPPAFGVPGSRVRTKKKQARTLTLSEPLLHADGRWVCPGAALAS